jgi:hypothetical protein
VSLFLDLDDYITSLYIGVLVGFTMEHVLLTIGCTLVNLDLDNLLFFGNFFAVAGLALVLFVDDLTLTLALVAGASALRVHARSKLLHHSPHTFALASGASHYSTALATEAIAL